MYMTADGSSHYWDFYKRPWFRYAPYGAGILTAIFLDISGTKKRVHWITRYIIYVFVGSLGLYFLYSTFDFMTSFPGFHTFPYLLSFSL